MNNEPELETLSQVKMQLDAATISKRNVTHVYVPGTGWVKRIEGVPIELTPDMLRALVVKTKNSRHRYTFGAKR